MAVATPLLNSIAEQPSPEPAFSVQFVSNFEDRSGHTVYEINVFSPGGASWIVQKRYSEVREMHDTLRVWLQDRLPPIPGRRIFGNHDPSFIEERQLGLERYLNGTLQIIASQAPGLRGFIGNFLGEQQTRRGRAPGAADPDPRHDVRGSFRSLSMEATGASHERSWAQSNAGECHGLSRSMTPQRAPSSRGVLQSRSLSNQRQQRVPQSSAEPPTESMRRRRWSRQGVGSRQSSLDTAADADPATGSLPDHNGPLRSGLAIYGVQEAVSCAAVKTPRRRPGDSSRGEEDAGALQQTPVNPTSLAKVLEASSESSAPPTEGRESERPIGTDRSGPEETPSSAARIRDTPTPARKSGASAEIVTRLEASFLQVTPAPHGESWDWPLSRPEKKERVRLIDQQVASLDRGELIEEIEQLRNNVSHASQEGKRH
jgi:hypothetical protein